MQPKHCLITGGSSGIGLACARLYAARGYRLSLIARRPEPLQVACAELAALSEGPGPRVRGFAADVADRAQLETALQEALTAFGPPDVVLTSAGMVQPGHFADLSVEVHEQAMAVNYLGTVYAVKAVLPHMQGRGGQIAMISSGAGLIGLFGYTAYSPSKFALRGFAEALRAEQRHGRIRISIAYPPDTDTPQLAQENLRKPAETRMMTQSAGVWSAPDVARAIVKGIDQGRFSITPGLEISLLHRLGSMLNPLLQARWARQVRRLRRDGEA